MRLGIPLPGAVRTIEYEIVRDSPENLRPVTLASDLVVGNPRTSEPVAVLKCIDCRGAKVIVVGCADRFQVLLESGAASNASGVILPSDEFPLVIDGWPVAS